MRAQLAERDALLESAAEGASILRSLIENIEAKGNYSPESTVSFLQQALHCVSTALSPSASAEPKCAKCHGRGQLRIATVYGSTDKSCPDCTSAEPSAPVERDEDVLTETLRTCEKWFVKHSPTAPLIGGFGDAEHPMLTCIRAALERKPS